MQGDTSEGVGAVSVVWSDSSEGGKQDGYSDALAAERGCEEESRALWSE